jgi:tetratricopeptide (TPR) repeat protein
VDNPQSKDDWILNHVHCISLIKQNKLEEAIIKLEKGVRSIEDINSRSYYVTALSYAYIKSGKHKKAVEYLKAELNLQSFSEVLIIHAYAELGDISESKKHFNSIFNSEVKKIGEISMRLSDRYNLSSTTFFSEKSKGELEVEIESLEFDILTDSYLIAA